MNGLEKQVRESFFNPILHILPVLVFIILGSFMGKLYAWIITLFVTVVITIYINKTYKRLFKWYLFYVCISIFIMCLMSITHVLLKDSLLVRCSYEYAFLISLLIVYALKKPASKFSRKLVSPLLSMTNNTIELYKLVKVFIYLAGGYLILFSVFNIVNNQQTEQFLGILNITYVVFVVFLIIYEFIRVTVIRKQLLKERWLPILNPEGKTVGSALQVSSFLDEKKYTHPVIRGVYVDNNKILLQMPLSDKLVDSPLWDSFLANHIHVNETAKECLEKTAEKYFGIKNLKTFFLTKYILETPFEFQYALVFIVCKTNEEVKPDPKYIQQAKWWTSQQIESNLDMGIFTEQFMKEFDLLKRSGLIESDEYNCNCEDEVLP